MIFAIIAIITGLAGAIAFALAFFLLPYVSRDRIYIVIALFMTGAALLFLSARHFWGV
jgi:hypothetical protein